MGALPGYLLGHTVGLRRFTGHGSTGPTHGAREEHPAFVDAHTRNVRARDGEQRVSSTTVYLQLDTEPGQRDLLDYDGRELRVIDVKVRDGGGLPTPDHVEIICE